MLSEKNKFKMFVFQTLLFFFTLCPKYYTHSKACQKKKKGGEEINKVKTQPMEVDQQMA